MGGSGNKRINIVDLERAEETDILRLESFLAADAHELARHQFNEDLRGTFFDNPGLTAPYAAAPATLDYVMVHDCLAGLMVRPDAAASLGVDPGEAAFFAPAYPNLTVDDSNYVAVKSAGLVVPNATLTFLANAGPGVRWDIVECQPTEVVVEATTRPVFTPPNGPFTPTAVDKVLGGEITFRIRRGTAGAGIPDPDPAWMPLAAVHVRTDATGFNNCDVYDIRPLVAERHPMPMCRHPISPPSSTTRFRTTIYEADLNAESGVGNGAASGGYLISQFAGYWSGGALAKNMPASTAANFGATTATGGSQARFNWTDALNQESGGITTGADRLVTLGLFFPRGYPRWVRYSQNALTPDTTNRLRGVSQRLPSGCRGILMVTNDLGLRNGILTPKVMPTHFGETQTCWGQAIAYALWDDSASAIYPAIGGGFDKKFKFVDIDCTGSTAGTARVNLAVATFATVFATWTAKATLSPGGANLPGAIRALFADIQLFFSHDNPGGSIFIDRVVCHGQASPDASLGVVAEMPFHPAAFAVPVGEPNTLWGGAMWIPLWPASTYDGGGSAGTGVKFGGIVLGITLSALSGNVTIQGYQL